MKMLAEAGRFTSPGPGTTHWTEHLRAADLSVGSYSIARGGTDDQEPHTEDEIYVVTAGHAVLRVGGATAPVGPGSVIYVPAGEEHRFTDVAQDLAAIVVFAPAEGSRADAAS